METKPLDFLSLLETDIIPVSTPDRLKIRQEKLMKLYPNTEFWELHDGFKDTYMGESLFTHFSDELKRDIYQMREDEEDDTKLIYYLLCFACDYIFTHDGYLISFLEFLFERSVDVLVKIITG